MLREQWSKLPFAEAVHINPKRAIRKGVTIPFVEMAALPTSGSKIRYLDERVVESGGSRFQNGDTLFARITPCAENGKIGFVDCLPEGCAGAGSTEFIVFGPRGGVTDPEFVYHLARSKIVREPALSRMIGTTGRQRVPNSVFAEIEVFLPPLSEQRRIAEILSSVDEAIQAAQEVIEQTRKVRQGVLKRLLTKGIGHTRFKQTEIGEIPEEWDIKPLGDIAEFVNGRGFKPHEWGATGLPIIRIQNLNGGTDFNYYEGPYSPKLEVSPGDLLFAWSGSRGTSFGPHIWNGPKGLLNYHTWRVALRDGRDRDFVYYALALITKKIETDSHGASALVHMQKRNIVDYKIPFPSGEERSSITNNLSQLDRTIANSVNELEQLVVMKSGLMSDLLTGRRRVSADLLIAAE
ncbi:restriction endonuclease subunit S [Microvirga sp. 2MCAF35]|uniref:restriction endonuclease subunit S n=1 Tax=Microvirga sp. 2MCAF35 TaxID=3232987 RepID=UPI003F9C29FD